MVWSRVTWCACNYKGVRFFLQAAMQETVELCMWVMISWGSEHGRYCYMWSDKYEINANIGESFYQGVYISYMLGYTLPPHLLTCKVSVICTDDIYEVELWTRILCIFTWLSLHYYLSWAVLFIIASRHMDDRWIRQYTIFLLMSGEVKTAPYKMRHWIPWYVILESIRY